MFIGNAIYFFPVQRHLILFSIHVYLTFRCKGTIFY